MHLCIRAASGSKLVWARGAALCGRRSVPPMLLALLRWFGIELEDCLGARDGALRRRVTALLCFGAALAREAAAQSQCETGEANLDAVTAAWGGRDPYPFAAQSCETTNDAEAEAAGARAARRCARPPLAPR